MTWSAGLPAADGGLRADRIDAGARPVLPVRHGANGKSVFVNTLATILGDYATNAPMDTFMETRTDRHPTDMAGLRGARFVAAIETEQGTTLGGIEAQEPDRGATRSARLCARTSSEFSHSSSCSCPATTSRRFATSTRR